MNGGWGISSETALKWMPLDLTDDKSTLVQVMAMCHQATRHYLNQCWPRFVLPYGITRAQWVKDLEEFVALLYVDALVAQGTSLPRKWPRDVLPGNPLFSGRPLVHLSLGQDGPCPTDDIDGLAQDCSNSSALVIESLQSCTKPSIYLHPLRHNASNITNGNSKCKFVLNIHY